jgi:PiT family inorganic phosphate transporter
MATPILILVVIWLAYSNGANDNFKGVATLYGSSTTGFRPALNDTPKIAALLLATHATNSSLVLLLVAAGMVIGGLFNSRRVAETMSNRITDLNPGQGLSANIVTAGLVLFASQFGLPVSTTHVSCGSIFGIGLVNRTFRWKKGAEILAAWVTTLPLAAVLSGMLFLLLQRIL